MANKKGKLFSQTLFGYSKSDVNEYIRQIDDSHADELSAVKNQVSLLDDQLSAEQARVKALEAEITDLKNTNKEALKKLNLQYERKLAELVKNSDNLKEKLAESEARATSYLKLADSSKNRAESAESKVAIFSSGLESANAQIKELNLKISEKDTEIMRLTELEAVSRNRSAQREHEVNEEKRKYIMIKRPSLVWFKRK